jgi:hypothetical protein
MGEEVVDWSQGGWKKLKSTGTRGKYRQVERRWVIEYIMTRCANAIYKIAHKRLGSVSPDIVKRAARLPSNVYKVYLPYADAICIWPDRIEIIEFKVHDPMKAISQLMYYKALAMVDADLKKFMPRPVVVKLVYWRDDPNIRAMCQANGIIFEVDHPPWLDPILRDYGYKV